MRSEVRVGVDVVLVVDSDKVCVLLDDVTIVDADVPSTMGPIAPRVMSDPDKGRSYRGNVHSPVASGMVTSALSKSKVCR